MKTPLIKLICSLFLTLSVHSVWAEQELVVLGSGEWPPYISENLPAYGFMSAIVSSAFEKGGRDVSYEFHHWARTEELAKEGKLAGSLGYIKTLQRLKHFYYSEQPIYTIQQAFFNLRGRPISWDKISDLKGYRIGISKGYSYGGEFMQAVEQKLLDTHEVNSELQGMRMLAAGRIDLLICDLDVGQSLLQQLTEEERQRIKVNPNLLNTMDVYVMLSKKHPGVEAMLKDFNTGLAALYEDGEYHRIIQSSMSGAAQ